MPDSVREQLSKARDRLLDLTLNNRLLNYRPPKRASVRIVDERIAQVWHLLVDEEKDFQFLAREEHELYGKTAKGSTSESTATNLPAVRPEDMRNRAAAPDSASQGESDSAEPDDDGADGEAFSLPAMADEKNGAEGTPKRYADRFLQTPLNGESLQLSLLRIYQAATAAVEELGVNVLFLAAGFLSWKPADREEPVKAPIFLIPVELERTSAKRRFKLKPLDDDPVLNPCLIRKLQVDYSIEMPERPETWDEFDIAAYLKRFGESIASQDGWQVTDDIYLGLFSFTKYLMYLDLDAANWPEIKSLTANALIRALCGDEKALAESATAIPSAKELDSLLDPESVMQVVDADSSQQVAIAAAKAGVTMVIQGPPGTGKSQTITNVIAECMAAGKTVLFVSQKMAALEVVKSRLERVGLGDFCLELHSTKSRRSNVLAELERVLSQPMPSPSPAAAQAQQLSRLRDNLNAYVRALHEAIAPTGMTPYYAMGRVALLRNIPNVVSAVPGCENWSAEEIDRMKDLVRSFARQIEIVWPPAAHPWRGTRLTALTRQVRRDVESLLSEMTAPLDATQPAAAKVAGILGIEAPSTFGGTESVLATARHILDTPEPAPRLLSELRWDAPPPEVNTLLATLKSYCDARDALANRYDIEQAKLIDWRPLADRTAKRWHSMGRFFSRDYWRDRSALKRVMLKDYRPRTQARLDDVAALARMSSLRKEIEAAEATGTSFFDSRWKGPESSHAEMLKLASWLTRARQEIHAGRLTPAGVRLCLSGADRSALAAAAADLNTPLTRWNDLFSRFSAALQLQNPGWFEMPTADVPFDALRSRIAEMQQKQEMLLDWTQYQESLQACERSPVVSFLAEAIRTQVEPDVLATAFEKQFLTLWLEDVFVDRDVLRQFNGARHEDAIIDFARADSQWVRDARNRLYAHLASQRPMTGFEAARSSQVGILQAEIRRKRGGRSIRRVLKDAGEVIQRVKPCFMMSPLSVAQFLDPQGVSFDVVVFDEASQVEPADALGAVARGSQLLLVGDRKQLPPTSFFTSISSDSAPGDGDVDVVWEGMESILDRGEAVLPALPLRWHYRSRHESLIEFSNSEFYNNGLVVFPSCHASHDEMGVCLKYEPADLYDRAKSRTNRDQARRVALAVFDHFRRFPEKSLGAATFSAAQQQAVLDEIERLRRQDDSLEDFFNPARDEHFFVKNLETIQGDERDVIFISVGHGRSSPAERVGAQISNLAGENGWRRLNVLVTRARERCVVFSSILARELDLSGTTARGVISFRDYLSFVETDKLPNVVETDRDFASPFEQAVYNALTERGVTLRKQVGCAGYAIDMAVVDPDNLGRYVLGIECDGATYHGSATARDRDRLRQQVLEDLGWRIHRIWSADWYRRPQAECDRVLETITKARNGQLKPRFKDLRPDQGRVMTQTAPCPPTTAQTASPERVPVQTVPYRCYEVTRSCSVEQFYTEPIDRLATIVAEVVAAEGPIHQSELVRRVAAQYDISRVGNRIEERVLTAASRCRKAKLSDAFYWPIGMTAPPLRRRDDSMRDIDLVCLEEIGLAARELVKAQFGMNRDDLLAQTARLLGFAPSSSKVKSRINEAIEREVAGRRLTLDANGCVRSE